jgi:hypothetical protein
LGGCTSFYLPVFHCWKCFTPLLEAFIQNMLEVPPPGSKFQSATTCLLPTDLNVKSGLQACNSNLILLQERRRAHLSSVCRIISRPAHQLEVSSHHRISHTRTLAHALPISLIQSTHLTTNSSDAAIHHHSSHATVPTEQPSTGPTEQPSTGPSEQPSTVPTEQPSAGPTEAALRSSHRAALHRPHRAALHSPLRAALHRPHRGSPPQFPPLPKISTVFVRVLPYIPKHPDAIYATHYKACFVSHLTTVATILHFVYTYF